MNTYLVIEQVGNYGKFASIVTVDESINLLSLLKVDREVLSISAYKKLKDARLQLDFLTELYKHNK